MAVPNGILSSTTSVYSARNVSTSTKMVFAAKSNLPAEFSTKPWASANNVTKATPCSTAHADSTSALPPSDVSHSIRTITAENVQYATSSTPKEYVPLFQITVTLGTDRMEDASLATEDMSSLLTETASSIQLLSFLEMIHSAKLSMTQPVLSAPLEPFSTETESVKPSAQTVILSNKPQATV